MKLQQFDGGLHTLPEPQFINTNEGTVYENINSFSGVLKSVKMPLKTAIGSKKYSHWYNKGEVFVDSDTPVDYVEYEGTLYYADRVNRPKRRTKDGNIFDLGLQVPITPTVFGQTSPPVISTVKITPTIESSGLSMKTQYYLLINEDATMQSNALHFSINTQGKVVILSESTNNPTIYPQIDSTTGTTRRVVTISAIEGVSAGAVGFKLYRQFSNEWHFVGVIPSSGSLVDNTENIGSNPLLNKDKFGGLDGTYQYVLTYYDNLLGNEGPPSDPTSEVDLENGGFIVLSDINFPSDTQVTHIRVYRVGGNLTQFTLVAQLERGTKTYTDNKKDVNLTGTLLSSTNAGPAPRGLAYLQQAYAMLFGAVGTKLHFTPIGYPDRWPATYYLQFEDTITGIAPVANGLLVFTRFKTYIVTGTGPTSLSQYLLSSDQGCVSFDSVQLLGTEAIWVSLDGICSSSGNRPVVITKQKLGKIELNPVDSALYDEGYYLVEASGYTLLLENSAIKRINVGVETLVVAKDVLYGYKDGFLYEMYAGEEDSEFKWTSARLTEGSLTKQKTYKDVFTYLEGQATINILIDDKLVQSKKLDGADSFTVKIPQEYQRGFFIQFEITGKGKIAELEYTVGT
ncbi:hypothetical protein [Dickeya phage Amaethon]|nr:hypothetical protein [Dickeya phage Amaethon]